MLLTACCKPIVEKEYVRPEIPATPADPVLYDVRWTLADGFYRLDEENAKNLLKDWELLRAQLDDLKTILDGLRK